MKPSNFSNKYPWNSVLQNAENEIMCSNILKILARTGDTFRPLSFEEYKEERLKDGNFSNQEETYFNQVIDYCQNSKTLELFSKSWS